MKGGKLITISTVVGQEEVKCESLPGELAITMSPERYSVLKQLAREAGKTVEDYFRQDLLGLPARKESVKPGKRLVVRTVIGQEVPDVQHLGAEIVLSLSPEHLTMFRERAMAAGKGSVEEYLSEDVDSGPVPYEIVGEEEKPAPVCPYMASTVAAFPANRRKAMLKRLQKAVKAVGMPFTDLLQAFVFQGLREIEATGKFTPRPWLPDLVFPKLHARLAEIDRVFEFPKEDGFTQWIMAQSMEDLLRGEDDLLFEAYTFDDPKKAHRDYRAMVARWRKEDGLPPIKLPAWRAKRAQKTERRAA